LEQTRTLLEHYDPDTINKNGTTALMRCGKSDAVECAALLIQQGCSLNVQDKHGRTALHWAALKGNLAITKLLLQHGIDMAVLDINNKTALDLAKTEEIRNKLSNFGS